MKLLLVDDHPLFAMGVAHALSLACCDVEVHTALTVQDGLAAAASRPDLDIALIDYRLGRDDGLAGLRAFGARFPWLARVMISGDEDPALAARARAAGASGFFGKSLPLDALLDGLQAIARGEVVFDASPPRSRPAVPDAPQPTARQLEVLSLVAQGQPNKRIASDLGIAERTVKLHVTALLESLGARNRTHLLVLARERGLLS
jgi:DNA-binding NarL/FixJ family response regulator